MGKDEKCGLTECPPEWGKISFNQMFPGGGVVVLEGKLVTVSQRAAGDLVSTDIGSEIFGVFNKLNSLFSYLLFKRDDPAVSEFRLGFDVDINCSDVEIIFLKRRLGLFHIVYFVRMDNLCATITFDR